MTIIKLETNGFSNIWKQNEHDVDWSDDSNVQKKGWSALCGLISKWIQFICQLTEFVGRVFVDVELDENMKRMPLYRND